MNIFLDNKKRILVLMSVYNGEKYICDQLDSILNQTNVDVDILVRDDGSKDSTKSILEQYRKRKKCIKWYAGDNVGPGRSFFDLINQAGNYEYYALSDQDDYWMKGKLYRAVSFIEATNGELPVLYHGNYYLVDRNLKLLEYGKENKYVSHTLKKASISGNATGCTMVFNRKLMEFLRKGIPSVPIMHDGWILKVCLCVGGTVFYDEKPMIKYRQHGKNVIGGREASFLERSKKHLKTIQAGGLVRSKTMNELHRIYGKYMREEEYDVCYQISRYKRGLNRIGLILTTGYSVGNIRVDIDYKMAVLLGVY